MAFCCYLLQKQRFVQVSYILYIKHVVFLENEVDAGWIGLVSIRSICYVPSPVPACCFS